VGNDIFWLGESGDGGASFTQVFQGTHQGNMTTGKWADVRGASHNNGEMTLSFTRTVEMDFVSGVRGAAFKWGRPWNETGGGPVP
jgi:hypothetical protein